MSEIVDVHSHVYPRWYIELLKRRTEIPRVAGEPGAERFLIFASEEGKPGGGRPMDESYWSIGAKLAFMDRFGIGRTVLSLGNPWLDPYTGEEGLRVARQANEDLATLGGETKGRIVGMGVLPGGGPREMVEIAREVAETPTLHGIILGTRPCGLTFDHPDLEPVWAELARTRLPVLVHPHYGSAMDEMAGMGHAGPLALGFPFETSIALSRLVLAGVLERHPALRIVGSHGGGTLPFLAGRLDTGWRSDPTAKERLGHRPSEDLSKLYLDAVVYHARALRTTIELVGHEKVMFGTDHPFSVADPEAIITAIDGATSGTDRDTVRHGAAIALYDLPRTPGA